MDKFEYRRDRTLYDGDNQKRLDDYLSLRQGDGWRLVSVDTVERSWTDYYWERKIKPKPTDETDSEFLNAVRELLIEAQMMMMNNNHRVPQMKKAIEDVTKFMNP